MKGKKRGSVVMELYENKVDTHFEGDIKGSDVDLLVRFLMRGYREWKAGIAKKEVK